MTNNPTIDGVSRDTLTIALRLVTRELETLANGSAIHRHKAALSEIRALLDAPAVERQEPTAEMEKAGCQAYMDADGMIGIMHNSSMGHAYVAMRALDPEVAALQSTIAQLQARIAELESGRGVLKCWSYKLGGEQRFYPTDPRQADFGGYAELMSDVEPLFTAPPAPADIKQVVTVEDETGFKYVSGDWCERCDAITPHERRCVECSVSRPDSTRSRR